jgi:hypothetical protein
VKRIQIILLCVTALGTSFSGCASSPFANAFSRAQRLPAIESPVESPSSLMSQYASAKDAANDDTTFPTASRPIFRASCASST